MPETPISRRPAPSPAPAGGDLAPSRAHGLFRTKSLDDLLESAGQAGERLRRVLGPVHVTLLGIGAIVGAGIFATIGTAAAGDAYRPGAGPALMVSFVITAIVCSFTALCDAGVTSVVAMSESAKTIYFTSQDTDEDKNKYWEEIS